MALKFFEMSEPPQAVGGLGKIKRPNKPKREMRRR
jgi:hypothetical protein